MGKSSILKDGEALVDSLRSAYTATPTNLKVVYMAIVGSFPFNSFLSEVLSCIDTAVLAVCLRSKQRKQGIQGFISRTCLCRLYSLQFSAPFGDHEFSWID
ncbi:hypothetical protein RND71_004827 [Anisodus tanguticus]|uniref:Dolichyl-diphosphooligosaccharide--protein glycosyltransferase subunit DAD1 n=1 Tax=Anisodus tanguticus TaxID=243964 RepID=A0AAE1SQU5_9SOLA|nr:hypothetical protein RND71_004827 [Anisodus tanguticus]